MPKHIRPEYLRAFVIAVLILALIGLFAVVEPTFAGHCPAPSIPICP